jgi:diadenosine tetraphosphate (Ap4A) HIT family hydrolase
MKPGGCAFCRADVLAQTLWECDHYHVLADGYPRCVGHVLLVTREHHRSHMHAPAAWMAEFQAAQERVRRFLRDTFGRAAFYENGGRRQEVPHAHLHGLPFEPVLPPEWLEEGGLGPIRGWEEARQECERSGYYFYLEGGAGRYLVPIESYKRVLGETRAQLLAQTEARLDPRTGRMARGGPEMVERTAQLWREWSQAEAGERAGAAQAKDQ